MTDWSRDLLVCYVNDRWLVTWLMLPKWQTDHVTNIAWINIWSRDQCCLKNRLVTWSMLPKNRLVTWTIKKPISHKLVTWPIRTKWQIDHVNLALITDRSRDQCRLNDILVIQTTMVTWPICHLDNIDHVTWLSFRHHWSRDQTVI